VRTLESLPPEWRITAYYAIALCGIIVLAKAVSLSLWNALSREKAKFFLFAPALSSDTWLRLRCLTLEDVRALALSLSVAVPLMAGAFAWFPVVTTPCPWWLRSYLSVIPFWLLVETIDLVSKLSWAPFRRSIPSLNDRPWRSRTLAEFWGRRWNRLFGDWFRQVCFRPFSRRPTAAVIIAFTVSALVHEALVSVPFWVVYDGNRFGWMLGYFSVQAVGIVIERQWLRSCPRLNRVFVWLVVLAPVPLVLNEGTLLIFHLARTPAHA